MASTPPEAAGAGGRGGSWRTGWRRRPGKAVGERWERSGNPVRLINCPVPGAGTQKVYNAR